MAFCSITFLFNFHKCLCPFQAILFTISSSISGCCCHRNLSSPTTSRFQPNCNSTHSPISSPSWNDEEILVFFFFQLFFSLKLYRNVNVSEIGSTVGNKAVFLRLKLYLLNHSYCDGQDVFKLQFCNTSHLNCLFSSCSPWAWWENLCYVPAFACSISPYSS